MWVTLLLSCYPLIVSNKATLLLLWRNTFLFDYWSFQHEKQKVIQLVYWDQKAQRIINFIILLLNLIRLATDIMIPEGAMLSNYSNHCSCFSFPQRWKRMEEKIEVTTLFLWQYYLWVLKLNFFYENIKTEFGWRWNRKEKCTVQCQNPCPLSYASFYMCKGVDRILSLFFVANLCPYI